MTRMPEITSKADIPEAAGHIIDAIVEDMGKVAIPFTVLLNSPEVARRMLPLRTYLRAESALTPLERYLAILVAARECDCACVWSNIVLRARGVGAREEVIDVIGHNRPIDTLTEEEAIIVAYGRELLRNHRVSDATFEAARARYGNLALTDLTALIGLYNMMACVLNAFDVESDPGKPHLP